MKIIIAGSRDFSDYELLASKMAFYTQNQENIQIISGTARGADKLGERWARENALYLYRFPAEWQKFGPSAGLKRNEVMAHFGDALVAFWDNKSKGTRHMINYMRSLKKPVRVVNF